jgi:hypothetical protein
MAAPLGFFENPICIEQFANRVDTSVDAEVDDAWRPKPVDPRLV